MAKKGERNVGIYVRLSKEDTRAGESVSIENQKLMLTKHVRDMGWELKEVYRDDGFSGTNQNRPALQRMLSDVRDGHINTVLVKDLSRLGRNYLEVGNLAEIFFPEHGCELVSLNEKLDDMTVFRNWFNEQHSKSTSVKVRAAKRVCAENGKYVGAYAPYGYIKDKNDRHTLMIDVNTAPTVRRIFGMRASGMGYRAIAARLSEDGIVTPREYYYQGRDGGNPLKANRSWNETSVRDIVRNEAYIGNLVQCRYGSVSFKNRKMKNKPEEEWVRAEAKHEPLIDRGTWDRVKAIAHEKLKLRPKSGGTGLFSGLLYCADCGFKLRSQTKRYKRKDGSEGISVSYMCGTYAHNGKSACSIHSINEKALREIVREDFRTYIESAAVDGGRISAAVLAAQKNGAESCRNAYLNELNAHNKQTKKLDLLIENLYLDKIGGNVPESLFNRQAIKYERERAELRKSAEVLEAKINRIDAGTHELPEWGKLTGFYSDPEGLDPETLHVLINSITVGETRQIDGKRVCDLGIEFNF